MLPDLQFEEQIEMPDDIRKELEDEAYAGLLHGRTGPYDRGCRGPLCERGFRIRSRERYRRRRERLGKPYNPDYRIRIDRDQEREAELEYWYGKHAQEWFKAKLGRMSR
jgi:hypothetical protein